MPGRWRRGHVSWIESPCWLSEITIVIRMIINSTQPSRRLQGTVPTSRRSTARRQPRDPEAGRERSGANLDRSTPKRGEPARSSVAEFPAAADTVDLVVAAGGDTESDCGAALRIERLEPARHVQSDGMLPFE